MHFNPGVIYSLLLSFLIILLSCSTYPSIKISSNLLNKSDVLKKEKKTKLNKFFKQYSLLNEEDKGYLAAKDISGRIYYRRFLIYSSSLSIPAEINNKAVEYVIKGMYDKAKFLFIEALNEGNNFVPALNNLGVVYELLRQKNRAFKMYSSACLKDPEDEFIRWNFLFFCDNRLDSKFYKTPGGIYFLQQ